MSGLHGANRLASNSVLECLVFGLAAARHVNARWGELRAAAGDPAVGREPGHRFRRGGGRPPQLAGDPPLHVGLCRHRPHHQAARAGAATGSICCARRRRIITAISASPPDLIELRNLVEVADLIVRSALARKESRGLHYTLDYPDMLPEAADTVLSPSR